MSKKDTRGSDTAMGGLGGPPAPLTPLEIQQKEFRVSRFGGYKMRDVDEFLDQITDSFTALTAEVDRFRAGGAAPVVGAPDLDDVSRQADEIIARARAEAARITGEAKAAPSMTGPPGSTSSREEDKPAVNAFLSQEREFLQSLAGLVQQHAETVKGMAKSSRPGPTPPATAGPDNRPPVTEPASASPPSPAFRPPTPSEAATPPSESLAESSAESPAEAAAAPDPAHDEPTVRIEEPAPAGASRSEPEREGDRSLRELFWGED